MASLTSIEPEGRCCVYCDRPFGTVVSYNRRRVVLQETIDHLVPRATERSGVEVSKNKVLACQICNRLKGSYIPANFMDARLYVLRELLKRKVHEVSGTRPRLTSTQSIETEPARPVTGQSGAGAAILKCCSCGKEFKPHKWNQRSCSSHCADRAYNLAHPVARQRALPLDPEPQPVPPVVDQRPDRIECEKLKGDNALVLRRLRCGPATTLELAQAAPRSMAIHSRVADCRTYLKPLGETVTRRRIGPRLHLYFIEAVP